MESIITFIQNFFTWIFNVGKWAIDGALTMLIVLVKILIEGMLTIVLALFQALDVGQLIANLASQWGLVDSRVIYMITQLGIPSGLSILGYAFLLRLMLNFIPAALTRV